MKVYIYIIINILVIAFPLALSFDRRVTFFRQWRALLPAVVIVGAFYLAQDAVATAGGNWSFDPKWTGAATLLGLPVGEWLFFLTVPYACIFIYACIRAYLPEKRIRFPRKITWLIFAAAALSAWLFRRQTYTAVVMSVLAVTSVLLNVLRPDLLESRQFWISLGISFLTFLIVNGILTGVPVVLYNSEAIWGIRVITIPLEDFFYNFCLLSLEFMFFRIFLDGLPAKDPNRPHRKIRRQTAEPLPGEFAGPGGTGSVKKPAAAYGFLAKHGETP